MQSESPIEIWHSPAETHRGYESAFAALPNLRPVFKKTVVAVALKRAGFGINAAFGLDDALIIIYEVPFKLQILQHLYPERSYIRSVLLYCFEFIDERRFIGIVKSRVSIENFVVNVKSAAD